jgi:Cu-processing system ATP-binding protein
VIALEKVGVTIDNSLILDDISFELRRGEAVALTGANGSGKSTVLRCLLGLVPFRGRARIGGYDVVRDGVRARAQVGYVPQKPAFGDATALEVLTFAARLRGGEHPLGRARPLLDAVGLAAHAGERARTFSGGMQQRLSWAVALISEAPVLLLDEPTASLDREGQAGFFDILAMLRRGGRTLLIASHRPEEVARLTDRVIELSAGRLVSDGCGAPAGVLPLRVRGAR